MSAAALERTGYRQPVVAWNGLTVTDLFCGAGGSSSGLVAAGYKVLMAANHWKQAIDSHQVNHPETDHDSADISQVEPSRFPTTDILWASPECTNHSVAKGIKPHRTLTTTDRYSLVTGPVDINDCEFRMLTPDEIKRGMGFAADYYLGGTKREQVKQSGNAVTPPNARDLGASVAEFLLGIEVAA